jgi:putative ABC transport system ATP-binding protein
MNPSSQILELAQVTKSFRDAAGRIEVLRGIDLLIAAGEFLMITGQSGSGKTTLLNLVALLDKPDSGTMRFKGQEIGGLSDSEMCALRARDLGMVFQKFHLLPHRSALDNVMFRWRYVTHSDDNIRDASQRALAQVGLSELGQRPARLLSAGEMQRLAIARAVALPPRLLVADEPTGNLDRQSSQAVMECFKKLNDAGMTIMMVTHNDGLLRYGTRHLVLQEGALVPQ